jgi:hypothetical protein
MQRILVSSLFCLCSVAVFAETQIDLSNGGFEGPAGGWSASDKGMSRIVPEAARTGKLGLRVVDESDKAGSSCRSPAVKVSAGKTYALRFWTRAVDGVGGVGVYMQFFDAKGKGLNTPQRHNELITTVPKDARKWRQLAVYGKAPDGAATLTAWVHSFNGSKGKADFDDFSFAELTAEEAAKIKVSKVNVSRSSFKTPDPARVREIATMLHPQPAGMGRPASDRAAWGKLTALPEAASIISGAEKYVDTPPPELPDELYLEFTKTGNRTHYQRPYGQCSRRISAMLLAECLEYNGRFLKPLERDVLAMCNERSWTMPAHDGSLSNFNGTLLTIDLGSSARGWLLSSVDYWLGDKLDPVVRKRLRAEVKRRIFDPYLTAVREGNTRGNWWMRGNNNWNAVCTAGVVGTALALVESPRDRAEFLAAMETSIPYFLSGFTDDGYCSEGMGYWNYGFGHFMMLGLSVRAATDGKLDIFQGEKLKRIAAYAKGYQIQPGKAPYFADGGGSPSADIWDLIRQVYPDAVPVSAKMPGLLRGGHVGIGLRAFGQEPPPAEGTDPGLPIRTWFGDAQVLISRSKPDAAVPFGAAIKGGHNAEHHNHNDVGSYTIVLDGSEMMGDPGGEVYTRRTFSRERYVSKVLNSYGHPVPMVAGTLQATGRQSAAQVLAAEFSSVRDRLELDISAAYRVPELTSLTRRFCYDRRERIVEIIDEVAFAQPKDFNTPLITYRKVFRRDDNTLFLYDTQHCVQVSIGVEGGLWKLQEEDIENPGKRSPKRLAVTFLQPVKSARVRFAIQPCALPDDLPGIYRKPEWGKLRPQPEQGVKVQAEDPSGQTGGEVTVCEKPGASGKAFKFWNDEGHALEYVLDVPKAGTYALLLRVCGTDKTAITRKVLVDGKPLAGVESFLFPDTGGWSSKESDWQDVYLTEKTTPALVKLSAGKHVVKLVNDCGVGLNMDWLELVPVQE